MRNNFVFVDAMADLSSTLDNDELGRSLVDVFAVQPVSQARLVEWAVTREVENAGSEGELFRGGSLATRMVAAYMERVAQPWLKATVRPCIRAVVKESRKLEVDPSQGGNSANVHELEKLLSTMIDALDGSAAAFPAGGCELAAMVSRQVGKRFPGDAQTGAVSRLVFLRLVVPAVASPHKHGLVKASEMNDASRRNCLLLSKLVQSCSTSAGSGGAAPVMKESFMQAFSDAVQSGGKKVARLLGEVVKAGGRSGARGSMASMPPETEMDSRTRTAVKHVYAVCDECAEELVAALDFAGNDSSGTLMMSELCVAMDGLGVMPERRKRAVSKALERRTLASFFPDR